MEQKVDYRGMMDTERSIYFKDLILYILEKAWLLFILAVVGAAAYAGYKYERIAPSTGETVSVSETIETLEEDMTDADIAEVQAVLALEETIESQTEYLTNSVYMQLDGQCVDKVTMNFQIYASDDAENITDFYVRYVNNGGLAADLLEEGADLDAAYLKELIYAANETRYLLDQDLEISSDVNELTVTVIHEDKEQCEALAEQVASAIESYHRTAASAVGTHELTQTDCYYNQIIDSNVWNQVNNYTSTIAGEETRLDTMKDGLDGNQTALLEAYETEDAEDTEETETTEIVASESGASGISKKALVIGAICGIVLGVLILVVWYILRGTVNCTGEIQEQYNFRILGEMGARKGLFQKKADEKAQLELLIANIQSACRIKDCDSVLFVGALADRAWVADMQSGLQKEGIGVETIEGCNSPENLKKLETCGNVILSGILRQTKYDDLQREVSTCLEQQADILGVVVSY